MKKLRRLKIACAVSVFCTAAVIGARAQTFTSLLNFNGTVGGYPNGSLVQGLDGNFYGTTSEGGANGDGTVFKITPGGTLTTLYNFCSQSNCADGADPYAGLVLATDGNFYGTARSGGANSYGTVFKITPGGTLTTLYSFDYADGAVPYGGLVQATNGDFYGTANEGGAYAYGTVFKITPQGALTTLHSFCAQGYPNCTDGASPWAGLVQATDGNFYGTTQTGGASSNSCYSGCGTVFKITPGGALTTLHRFDAIDGDQPLGGLVQAANGNFYGTTYDDGAGGVCGHCGTVFKITPGGKVTTLHTFELTDGGRVYAGLVQATDGNFYGTTADGGLYRSNCATGEFSFCGTAFEITPGGALTTLHKLEWTDGAHPFAGLVQGTDGNFYGTTEAGGANGEGTVFSLSVDLGPFVETLPTSGKVGAAVKALGTDLTGATSMTFNGKPAVFKVISHSEIGATVPVGATTGPVQVVTPSGTLTSNVNFQVLP